MRFASLSLLLALLLPGLSNAQSPIPDQRIILYRNTDFFGGDIASYFDTSYEACERICLADTECAAFTYNAASNSCFPKSGIASSSFFEGALSAEIVQQSQAAVDLAHTRLGDLEFLDRSALDMALRQAREAHRDFAADTTDPASLVAAARLAMRQGRFFDAMQLHGRRAVVTDSAGAWLGVAIAARAEVEASGRWIRELHETALAASINSYLRSGDTLSRADSLVEMAFELEALREGEAMVSALMLANTLRPGAETRQLLDDAIGKYGFRIVAHEVQSNSAAPRICAEFSSPIAQSADISQFVVLPDRRMAAAASGREICVDGAEHGQNYEVAFRRGLPAENGQQLSRTVNLQFYVRDREPSVVFPGRGYVLPRLAGAAVPVETVNADTLELTLRRVSDRNLLRAMQDSFFGQSMSSYRESIFESEIAETVWQGIADVGMELNRDILTRIPMGEAIAELPVGIYALTARVPNSDEWITPAVTQWFILSDLGVSSLSGNDGLHIFVRSFTDATAKAGVTVDLLSGANRVLATQTTDDMGYAHFASGLIKGTGSAAPAMLLLQDGEVDVSFLSLTEAAFDLSDRGVAGLPPAPPINVFLTTDRGAYRAGETIETTILVRDRDVQSIDALPITAILSRPDGVEYERIVSTGDAAGGHLISFSTDATAPRGTWRISVFADVDAPPLASKTVVIEDFLPERLDFALQLADQDLQPGSIALLRLDANYLFGAPAANLPVEGEITLRASTSHADHPGYSFGRHDAPPQVRTGYIPYDWTTGENGRETLRLELPELTISGQPGTATFSVRVIDSAGRPVERKLTQPLAVSGPMIGIRSLFDGVVAEGSEAAFSAVALGSDVPLDARWTLNRLNTRYQWYRLNGSWRWEPIVTRERIASGDLTLGEAPADLSLPVDWGRHELVFEAASNPNVASSVAFYSGWYTPVDVATTPDVIETALDRATYLPGDTAQLKVTSRFKGTGLITVLSDQLIDMRVVALSPGENLIDFAVTEDWGVGAYVTATAIRPLDLQAAQNPSRSIGLSYASIAPGERQLQVTIDAPDEITPRQQVQVEVEAIGAKPGEQAYLTLSAVDVGILNLTGFQNPDPSNHYFGQRRLGMEIRDLYGRLIDGMSGAMGQVRSGGDDSFGETTPPLEPTEELVALFSGLVTVGPDGKAMVDFDIPDFNGTLRFMAVAWTKSGVGQAAAEMLIRDPVVISTALPRVLAPGDQSRIRVDLFNAAAPAGVFGLWLGADGVELGRTGVPKGVELAPGEMASFSVPLKSLGAGDFPLDVAVRTPDGREISKSIMIHVQDNSPEISRTTRVTLDRGRQFITTEELLAGFQPESATIMVAFGPLARFDVAGMLSSLEGYAYGCTEQIASKALPLLYYRETAKAVAATSTDDIDERISDAIRQVLARQTWEGGFGLWSAGYGDLWLDAYATDFLSRARAEGHEVPEFAFESALANLRNQLNYAPDFDEGGGDIAYALMVLAREGRANIGDLRYFADQKATAFNTAIGRAQLGAALALYGDRTRAESMFGLAMNLLQLGEGEQDEQFWRDDFGSGLRDAMAVLALGAETGSKSVDQRLLSIRLGRIDRALSTQETAWSLLAARALAIEDPVQSVAIDGQLHDGAAVVRYSGPDVDHSYQNQGSQPVDLTFSVTGKAEGPASAGGNGYAITRTYYTMDGQPAPEVLTLGERYVVVLNVIPYHAGEARLMIVDPLPGGLEIENPNLLRSGQIAEFDWFSSAETQHTEFLSDRMRAAVDRRSADPFQIAYVARAVSPGDFLDPAASVEDMYRPLYRARSEGARLRIAE